MPSPQEAASPFPKKLNPALKRLVHFLLHREIIIGRVAMRG
jgi:hypothetical protein